MTDFFSPIPASRRRHRRSPAWFTALVLVGLHLMSVSVWAGVVVVANGNVHKLDADTVQRIYTGKVIEVSGVQVVPVHLPVATSQRQHFITDVMQTTEDSYQAYWTVRRYVGRGTPPREMHSAAEVLGYIAHTPGGIGYIDEAELPPGVNVVWRR